MALKPPALNPSLTLAGIPPETFEYRLGNRSALEWVIDQYRVSEDPRTGIRSDPNRTLIPDFIVDAVCHVPYCAHPSYTQGYYDRDNAFYLAWDQISESPDQVQAYLDEWVYGVKDRAEYWQKLGPEVHARLSVAPRLSAPVNYGLY